MDPISSTMDTGTAGLYAVKKAIELQSDAVLKVLESAQAPEQSSSSGASVTGIGQNLDIRA